MGHPVTSRLGASRRGPCSPGRRRRRSARFDPARTRRRPAPARRNSVAGRLASHLRHVISPEVLLRRQIVVRTPYANGGPHDPENLQLRCYNPLCLAPILRRRRRSSARGCGWSSAAAASGSAAGESRSRIDSVSRCIATLIHPDVDCQIWHSTLPAFTWHIHVLHDKSRRTSDRSWRHTICGLRRHAETNHIPALALRRPPSWMRLRRLGSGGLFGGREQLIRVACVPQRWRLADPFDSSVLGGKCFAVSPGEISGAIRRDRNLGRPLRSRLSIGRQRCMVPLPNELDRDSPDSGLQAHPQVCAPDAGANQRD